MAPAALAAATAAAAAPEGVAAVVAVAAAKVAVAAAGRGEAETCTRESGCNIPIVPLSRLCSTKAPVALRRGCGSNCGRPALCLALLPACCCDRVASVPSTSGTRVQNR